MRRPPAAPLLVLLLSLPAGGPAAADTFVLKNGTRIDGYPAARSPSGEQTIGTATGVRKVPGAVVAEVQASADPAADFEKYFGALGKKDADGAAFLGSWAKERGLPDAAKKAFGRALELKPDHVAAREGLGFRKVDGAWLTPEQVEERRREDAIRDAVVAALEKSLGARPEAVVTAHWRYASFLGDQKTAERAKDMERAFAEAVGVLGSEPWRDRALAVACQGSEQYHKWIDSEGRRLPGMRGPFLENVKKATGLKWHEPATLVRSDVPSTGAMHAAFVHTAGHLLVNLWHGLNREQPFWIEEGFGGWMEEKLLNSRTSYCYALPVKGGYGTMARDIKAWEVDDPDWKTLVKQAMERNEFLPLDQMDSLPAGQFSRREVGQAFSFVSFLLKEKEPARFRDYLQRVKAGTKSPTAFKQAYGQSFEEIEPPWRSFVPGW